ncbi:MAG: Fic family protein [Erysipelotrichaceae bacterium]|jgi:hypothetical protein|nr:Fic family protein [Erysipelotrichaceae bacterium]
MKIFSLKEQAEAMLTNESSVLISLIERKNSLVFLLPKKNKLNRLHDLSKRRSVTSSNKIEGIEVTKKREEELLLYNANAETLEDYALKGYNAALTYIMDNYEHLSLSEELIKDLHYKMYEQSTPDFGGKYKEMQNYIRSIDSKGNELDTLFIPSKPEEVKEQIGNLVWQFNDAFNSLYVNKLFIIFIFILDFLSIHPFPDGNGRISRLLTSFLLLKSGYKMDEYYSLSYLILEHQEDYYQSLVLSDIGWKENKNNPYPFVHFHLICLIEGYKKIEYIKEVAVSIGKCADKVFKIIIDHRIPTSREYIEEILYEYSRIAIEKALNQLINDKKIEFVSKGRSARYIAVI